MFEVTPERLLCRQQVCPRRWCWLWFSLMATLSTVIILVSVCMQMILWFIYAATQQTEPKLPWRNPHVTMMAVILNNLFWTDLESCPSSPAKSSAARVVSDLPARSQASQVLSQCTRTLLFSFLCTNFMLTSLILVSMEREEHCTKGNPSGKILSLWLTKLYQTHRRLILSFVFG